MTASRMLIAGVMLVSSLFAGSISHAALLTFAYEGTVNNTGGFPDSGPFDAFLGETIRVEYTFETATPDNNGSSNGDYLSAITSAEITVGSNVYTATDGTISIRNNGVNPDQYIVDIILGLAGPTIGGQLPARFQVILTDDTKTFFSSDALPTVQPDPSGFTSSVLQFSFCPSCPDDFGFLAAANPVIPACGPTDTDGDGVADCDDNCPFISNIGQEDGDGDTVGDVCDNCAQDVNPDQGNLDTDSHGNVCDNCEGIANESQADGDNNGVGNACDTNPSLSVCAGTCDFVGIQSAVDTATESGTTIQITGTYGESVVVDRAIKLIFEGSSLPLDQAVNDAGGIQAFLLDPDAPVVNGGAGPAFDFTNSLSGSPHEVRNLIISGSMGVRTNVSTIISNVWFVNIAGLAMELGAGDHRVNVVHMDASVNGGIDLADRAGLDLTRSELVGQSGNALRLAGGNPLGEPGVVKVQNSLIAQSMSNGILLLGSHSVNIDHVTMADNLVGINNGGSGAIAVTHTVLWGNGTDHAGVLCSSFAVSLVGAPTCPGMLSANPGFVDRGNGNYHLLTGSPALEVDPVSTNFPGDPCFDLDGGPRIRDHDGDGLAVGDLGAYEMTNTSLVPGEVSPGELIEGLHWLDNQTLLWDAVAQSTEYHIYRSEVPDDTSRTCADAIDSDRTDTQMFDSASPLPGVVWYYLITAEDGTGEEGTLGFGKCSERSNLSPCP